MSNIRDDNKKINFDGNLLRMNSQRYKNFKQNGTVCTKCGLIGQYFYMERCPHDKNYHFNLYGINAEGKEIMLTKDHIIPKSKGGMNVLNNYQCLCEHCNSNKGSQDNKEFMQK